MFRTLPQPMADLDFDEDLDEETLELLKEEKKRVKNEARVARRKRKREIHSLVHGAEQPHVPGAPRWKRVKIDDNVVFEEGGFFGLEELEFDGDVTQANLVKLIHVPSTSALTAESKNKFIFEPDIADENADQAPTIEEIQKGQPAEEQDEEQQDEAAEDPMDEEEPDNDEAADEESPEGQEEAAEPSAEDTTEAEPLDLTVPANKPLTKRELKGKAMNEALRMDPVLAAEMVAWKEAFDSLHPKILQGLKEIGFKTPTAIQKAVLLPALRDRKDIIGAAETGSGKTLSFVLPLLHQILEVQDKQVRLGKERDRTLKALILSPTRELALQIVDHAKAAAKHTGVKIAPLIGGISIQKQERVLSQGPDIVVATIGRLWDYISNPHDKAPLDFSKLRFLVLDEADKIIEFGRFVELQNVLRTVYNAKEAAGSEADGSNSLPTENQPTDAPPAKKKQPYSKPLQTYIFSATLSLSEEARKNLKAKLKKKAPPKKKKKNADTEPKDILDKLTEQIEFMRKVAIVDVTTKSLMVSTLEEAKIYCLPEEKDYYMYYFLERYRGRTLIFVNSISNIRRVVPLLKLLKIPAWPMHANMQQRQRLKNLDRFKSTPYSVIVSTDVLARGVDVPNVDHVLHYQIPMSAETYVHRSGRTARAKAEGVSLSIVDPADKRAFSAIHTALQKEEPKDFPVDMSFYNNVKKRVSLARKLDKAMHQMDKVKVASDWLRRQAEEADLELDEDLTPDLEEEKVPKHKRVQMEQNIAKLREELEDVLSEPLLPAGTSRSYITRNMSPAIMGQTETRSAHKDVKTSTKKIFKFKSKAQPRPGAPKASDIPATVKVE